MKKKLFTALFIMALVLATAGSWAKEGSALSGVVNVNTATIQELMLLPGVGEAKARLIIEARKSKPFSSNEDLLGVKGIGEKMIANWLNHIAFEGATTLKDVAQTNASATQPSGR